MNVSELIDFSSCTSFDRKLENVIVLAYMLPSLLFYFLVICVLFESLRAPFYRIFALGGLIDIIGWVAHFLCTRALFFPAFYPFFASLPNQGLVPSFLYFLSYYTTFAPYASTFFLTLNRFVSAFSTRTNKQEWIVPIAYTVILLYPLSMTWFIWLSKVEIRLLNKHDPCVGFMIHDTVKPFGIRKSFIVSVVSFVQGTVVMSMNVAIALRLFLRRRQLPTSIAQVVGNTKDTEIRLFLLTLILFAHNVTTCACQVAWYIGGNFVPDNWTFILMNVEAFGGDVHVCTAPWFLIIMSTAVRSRIRNFLDIVLPRRKPAIAPFLRVKSSTPSAMIGRSKR